MSADLVRVRDEFGFPGDDALVIRCTAVWAMMIGAVSMEVFGQYGSDTFTDPHGLFDQQIELAVDLLTTGPQN
jgi:hypothetical protein